MTFARGNALDWGFNEKLTSAQMNATDAQWPDALDGAAGGVYAPSSVIQIGGLGIGITGPADFTGVFTLFTGIVESTLTINGGSSAEIDFTSGSTLRIGSGATVLVESAGNLNVANGGTIDVLGSGTFKGEAASIATWAGAWTFSNASSVSFLNGAGIGGGAFTVTSPATAAFDVTTDFTGTLVNIDGAELVVKNSGSIFVDATAGTSLVAAPLKFSGAGHPVYRVITGADADTTYAIADADLINVLTLTGNRIYTLSNTGAVAGCAIEISLLNHSPNANLVTVKNNGGGTLSTMKNNSTTGEVIWAKFVHDGSNWTLWDYSQI